MTPTSRNKRDDPILSGILFQQYLFSVDLNRNHSVTNNRHTRVDVVSRKREKKARRTVTKGATREKEIEVQTDRQRIVRRKQLR